ncbi:hypothetical protein J3R83DRAFT_5506 [Lanmaoa asiatica]|nr:hypothetical protein J3R83DRAFT_5506 [Lanmaoa asiatica]
MSLPPKSDTLTCKLAVMKCSKRPNQNKPSPPLGMIEPHIRRLWAARLTDRAIIAELRKVIDLNEYGIGLTKFKEIRATLGLHRARQQGHSPDSIRTIMVELRKMYPNAGVREMTSLIVHEHMSLDAINHVRNLYIDPNNPVFDMLPGPLGNFIELCYNELGRPPVERGSVWPIYLQIFARLQLYEEIAAVLHAVDNDEDDVDINVPLIEGLQDLHEKSGYLGGLANGMGPSGDVDMFADDRDLGDGNDIDAEPAVWVDGFTSDESDLEEEVALTL